MLLSSFEGILLSYNLDFETAKSNKTKLQRKVYIKNSSVKQFPPRGVLPRKGGSGIGLFLETLFKMNI